MSKRWFSILGITGTLFGITHYILNGKPVSRKANPPDKDKIFGDPRFASVKANCLEFGGASVLSKAICKGLGENVKDFKDSYFTSRLTGVCRIIIQKGRGKKGSREANVLNLPQALIGFQLHKKQIFNQIYTLNPTVTINKTRNKITVNIANSGIANLNYYPKSATHFKLTAAISTVSPHKWHPKIDKYQPTQKKTNALGKTIHSPILLCNMEHPEINLELKTPPIPSKVAITIWLGIQFGKEKNNLFTPLLTSKSMECIGVL